LKTLIFKRLLKTCRYNERWEVDIVNDYLKNSWWCFDQDSTIGNWGFKKRKAKWVNMDVINLFILKRLNWKIIMTEQSEKKKTNQFIWKAITRCICKEWDRKVLVRELKSSGWRNLKSRTARRKALLGSIGERMSWDFGFNSWDSSSGKNVLFRLFQRCKRKN
jgi:hypothetical protein